MIGNAEYIFGELSAWGPPSGGPPAGAVVHAVFWPGGRGVLLLENLELEYGATLRLTSISTPAGTLPSLGDLERDTDITEPNCWHFDLPAETQLSFLVTLPAADVDPPGHIYAVMSIQRTEP